MLDFELIRAMFVGRGVAGEIGEYEAAYKELNNRIEIICGASPDGDWGTPSRIREFALVLRQVQLHRAISLYEGSFTALNANSVYTMIVAIRALYETTAVLGYLHKRLDSWSKELIDGETIDKDIYALLLGGREGGIKVAPEAKNVLSMLEEADKAISTNIMGGNSSQYDMLMNCYKYLCEFSHPNFHSNSVAFDLDKEKGQFVFRYGKQMKDIEFKLIEYLLLCTPIFLDLYDKIGYLCKQNV